MQGKSSVLAPSRCRIVIFCGLLSTAMAVTAAADPAAQGVAPNSGEAATVSAPAYPVPTAPGYVFPELRTRALTYDGQRFWARPIFALITDYTWFKQDDASLAQVGEQQNSQDLRAARLGLIVRSKGDLRWGFNFAVDYVEKRTRQDASFQLYDLKVDIPIGAVKLSIGKQKEPFVFEMVGLSALLLQQERILQPFFVSRNTGVNFSGQLAGDRMTWAAGVFNDWLDSGDAFDRDANDYVARVTGLASVSPDNFNYLHFGVGLRRVGAHDGLIRFSGRPESNVADKYVDTGDFAADHASQLSLEAAWQRGSFALQAEHVDAWVDAPEYGNPHFAGSYVTASWVVTGEARPYVRDLGFARGITPTGRLGALELVLRYGHIDLTDAAIAGGVLDRWGLGVNWWASAQWKLGLSYGDADLERDGITGNTRMLLARMQWLY
jgi:phosphate-selective porin OprO/OprP